jgi:Bacterial protein of unknown function (HtrL_YibB)
MTQKITWVSALYDIGRKVDDEILRFDNYFHWIQSLLRRPLRMVFFTTPELRQRINIERPGLHYILEGEYPWQRRLPAVTATWEPGNIGAGCKDTPAFACLTVSKFEWLHRAAHLPESLVPTRHLGWIDAGIAKLGVSIPTLAYLDPPDRVRFMILNYISRAEVAQHDFVRSCRFKLAAGLITGERHALSAFCNRVLTLADAKLNDGVFGLEQEFMALAYRQEPALFDPYYGDFCDIVDNYACPLGTLHCAHNVRRDASRHRDREELARVIAYLNGL